MKPREIYDVQAKERQKDHVGRRARNAKGKATMADWNTEASRAAEHACDELFSDHRGVMKWRSGVAVFGNDGFRQDEKARLQVDIFRQYLSEAGIKELGFGLDDRTERDGEPIGEESRGYSWALMVDSEDLDALHRLLWEAHRVSLGARADDPAYQVFRKVQGGDIADE